VAPFGMGVLAPLLPAFHALHPGIQIELHLDDAVNDMVGDGYDVGFRVGELQDSSLVARPIAGMPFAACASAAYLAAHGTPATLEALSAHNCLRLRRKGSQNPMPWFLKGMEPALDKRCAGNFLANDFAALLQAAKQDQGIACVPLPQLLPFLRSGALKLVLGECVQARFQVYMHYPSRKNIPMRLRVFIDCVLAALEKNADLNAAPADLLAGMKLNSNDSK
jgi:DNA-binding transcriptional LysR family regulator